MSKLNRREFTKKALAAGFFLGAASRASFAAKALEVYPASQLPDSDAYKLVDPELVPALKVIPPLVLSPERLAELLKIPMLPPLPAPMPQPVSRMIPGAPGSPDVHIFVVDPNPGAKNRPVFVHTHGGGYVTPNPAMFALIQSIAHDCECVVVSVDYRLAPATHFPGSLNDNYAALKWVYNNAATLGIDRQRIAVGGESAGGGHAAALALRARDRAEIPLVMQLLIYPMLDDRTGSSRPAAPSMGRFIWTAQCNRFGWTSLLGVPAGSAQVPAGAVPARIENLAGLAPAWVGTGSIDLFAAEDITYAQRLMEAGVPTELVVLPGGYHAFDIIVPNAQISKTFTSSWKSALRRAFGLA